MSATWSARIPGAIALAAGLLTASACSAGSGVESPSTTPSAGASPSATPSPDPTAAAEAAAAADAELLPLPVDEIREWAETAVPGTTTEGHRITYSGWLSEHSSRRLTNTDKTVAAGSYVAQVACRGDGTITVSVRPVDAEPTSEPVVCQNSTIAFDAAIPAPGMVTELTLEGAPTVYAISFVDAPAP